MFLWSETGEDTVADPGGETRPLPRSFSPNTLKSPLNWLKFTKKTPGAPLFSDPGSATAAGADPRGGCFFSWCQKSKLIYLPEITFKIMKKQICIYI